MARLIYKQPDTPEPELVDLAFLFDMPIGPRFTVKLTAKGAGVTEAVTLAREMARAEAVRRQISDDYPRPER